MVVLGRTVGANQWRHSLTLGGTLGVLILLGQRHLLKRTQLDSSSKNQRRMLKISLKLS